MTDSAQLKFSEALVTARRRKRLTQTALAEKIGSSQPEVSRWENGLDTPRVGQLYDIVEETDAEWLLNLALLRFGCIAA